MVDATFLFGSERGLLEVFLLLGTSQILRSCLSSMHHKPARCVLIIHLVFFGLPLMLNIDPSDTCHVMLIFNWI